MSAINVNSITGRTGTHGPVLTGVTTATNGLNVTGGSVGIGTDNPSEKLNIVGSDSQLLNLIQDSGDLAIRLNDRGTGSAYIKVPDNSSASLTFETGGSERLRITSDGKVRVPDSGRFTCGTDDDLALRHSGTTGVLENNTGSFYIDQLLDDGDIYIRSDNGSGGNATYFQASGGDGQVRLFHYGTKKLNTLSTGVEISGNVVLGNGNGIDFSATSDSSGTTGSELLDDYEEGTFTPEITTTGTSYTYSVQTGRYTKIGRMVYVLIQINVASSNSGDGGSSIFRISPLPFNQVQSSRLICTPNAVDFDSSAYEVNAYVASNNQVRILYTYDNGNQGAAVGSNFVFGANDSIMITGWYETS